MNVDLNFQSQNKNKIDPINKSVSHHVYADLCDS